jgi:peptide methionine sulfoxide reductase MsrA
MPYDANIPLSFKDSKIVTEITPAAVWWNAEDYHQQYREWTRA